MRIFLLAAAIALNACSMRVEEKTALVHRLPDTSEIDWPHWQPSQFRDLLPKGPHDPEFLHFPAGEVVSYGMSTDRSETFAIISKREPNAKAGIFQLRQCFLPTSIFAGPSPLRPNTNELHSPRAKWVYSAYDFRSTFFQFLPSLQPRPKGLLVYHTSIMLLSVAEKQVVQNFRKKGWNVLVALPPDSLFRTKVPAQSGPEGTIAKAATLVAEDMDRHYLEQGRSLTVALEHLAHRHPEALQGRRVLMGTSAGTFGMPAEALLNPNWDALIFVSAGSNLLSVYESGSAGIFENTMTWLQEVRKKPPPSVTHIFSRDDYHEIYHRAAHLTRFHPGALAPRLQKFPILMIAGSIDHIIPDSQALALHHALGKPERWTAPLGHHLIALQLILEVDRIDQWIDQQ